MLCAMIFKVMQFMCNPLDCTKHISVYGVTLIQCTSSCKEWVQFYLFCFPAFSQIYPVSSNKQIQSTFFLGDLISYWSWVVRVFSEWQTPHAVQLCAALPVS